MFSSNWHGLWQHQYWNRHEWLAVCRHSSIVGPWHRIHSLYFKRRSALSWNLSYWKKISRTSCCINTLPEDTCSWLNWHAKHWLFNLFRIFSWFSTRRPVRMLPGSPTTGPRRNSKTSSGQGGQGGQGPGWFEDLDISLGDSKSRGYFSNLTHMIQVIFLISPKASTQIGTWVLDAFESTHEPSKEKCKSTKGPMDIWLFEGTWHVPIHLRFCFHENQVRSPAWYHAALATRSEPMHALKQATSASINWSVKWFRRSVVKAKSRQNTSSHAIGYKTWQSELASTNKSRKPGEMINIQLTLYTV